MKHLFCSDSLKFSFTVLVLGLTLSSCKHKTDFNSIAEVSYSKDIAPIITSNCTSSGCHGDAAYEKMSLTTYANLIDGGISPGSPEKSKLYSTLKSLGDDIMPKKPNKELSEKQIQLIYIWIGQGAKNN